MPLHSRRVGRAGWAGRACDQSTDLTPDRCTPGAGLWAASAATLCAIGRNPRKSLAAGASVLILGSIWVTQPQPGGGKHSPVTNEIAGNLFAPVAKDRKDTVGTKSEAAAVGHGNTATADPGNTAAMGSGNPEKAQADATSPAESRPRPRGGGRCALDSLRHGRVGNWTKKRRQHGKNRRPLSSWRPGPKLSKTRLRHLPMIQ